MHPQASITSSSLTHLTQPTRWQGVRTARRGSTFVYATMTLTLVVAFSAFSLDLSRFRAAKGELQAIADAAALNAANGLSNNTYVAKAQAAASDNKVDGVIASIPAGAVVPGYWSGTAFTANGTPRNAVRVTASRTKAAGTAMTSYLAASLGWQSPDLIATSTVALVNQAPYEWVGLNSISLAGASGFKVTSYDSTNGGAGEAKTTVKTNGALNITGNSNINADLRYGTSVSVAPQATVTGTTANIGTAVTYPPGSQVANLTGVTPVYSTTYDLVVNTNQVLAGGTYVVKNCNIANCNVTFTGPATIVMTGNMNINNVSFGTYGNLPTNLKFIATTPGTALTITNNASTMYADFYAPESTFSLSGSNSAYSVRGRGVFQSITASGAGSSLWYDRSLTASSLSKKAVVVD